MSTNQTNRIVFMGTPDFAVPTLRALLEAPQHAVVGVVTQPDRPAGRGQRVKMSPVKDVALAHDLPVIQPARLRKEPEAVAQIRAWQPDFLVVVAFGQILRQDVLDIPRLMPVNVHASLLPRWRGAAPLQAAIRAGDHVTGITTMQMDAGMDTGPILLQDSIPMALTETGQSLHDKLATLGANLLVHTLDWVAAGTIAPHPQPDDDSLVTYAPMLKKADGRIDWTESAIAIDRQVRAYTPWPGTFTTWCSQHLKILSGGILPEGSLALSAAPGTVIDLGAAGIDHPSPVAIGTGSGLYVPARVQLAGRSAVDMAQFINGAPDFIGSTLGAD